MDNRVESFLSFLIRPDDSILTGIHSILDSVFPTFMFSLIYKLLFCLYFCCESGRPGPGLVTSGVSQISDSEEEEGSVYNSNNKNDDRVDDININNEDDYESDDDDDNSIDNNNSNNNDEKKEKKMKKRAERKNKKLKRKKEQIEKEIINLNSDDDVIEIDIKNDKTKNNVRKSVRQVLHNNNQNKKWDDEDILDLVDDESASDGETFNKSITKNDTKNMKKRSRIVQIEKNDEEIDKKKKKVNVNEKKVGLKEKGTYRDRGNSTCSSDGDFAGVVLTD